MIKKTAFLTFAAAMLAFSAPSKADSKFLGMMWWPSHWVNQDYQPYYEEAIGPHNNQWDDTKLSPANWTAKEWVSLDGGNGFELIRKWYAADILRDQYVSSGVPYIEVGPNFYHLGGADKRRVMATVDAVYNVTAYAPKMFILRDYATDRVIGEYTKAGLDLQ